MYDNRMTSKDSERKHKETSDQTVKYFDISVSRDLKISMKENIENKIHKAGGILNYWLQRDISIFGRV